MQKHEMQVQVKIPLLGKLLERAYKQSVHRTYEKLLSIMREWEHVRARIGVDELLACTPPSAAAHWIAMEKGAIVNERGGGDSLSLSQQQHGEGINMVPQTPGPQVPEQIDS